MTWRSVHVRALSALVGAAIAALAAAVPAAASTTLVLVPYLSAGYRYTVVSHDAVPGFSDPAFDDSAFSTGDAGFGTGGFCPLDSTAVTYWQPNTDLLVRRTVNVPAGVSNVTVSIAIDNNVVAFWNGVQIGSDQHGGCAARDSYTYSVPASALKAGANVLAVRAIDTGGEDYFDVSVSATGSPASLTAAATSNGQAYTSGTWTSHDVVVTFTCTSSSAVTSVTPPQTVSSEGANQSVSGSCTDAAGSTASATFGGIDIDKTPPVVTYSSHPATYGVADTVNITCSATDALSGVASSTCKTVSGPAYSFNLGANTFSAGATDLAGNTGTGTTQFTVAVTGAGICTLVTADVTKPRLAHRLCELLAGADRALARGDNEAAADALKAFEERVARQAGRSLTADQAALLQRLAVAMTPAAATLDSDRQSHDGGGDRADR